MSSPDKNTIYNIGEVSQFQCNVNNTINIAQIDLVRHIASSVYSL
jgi:hypothetical protein